MVDKWKLYDLIYDRANKIVKKYNPCNIQVKNKKVTCKRGKPCCDGCFYLSDSGCSTKCLGCKFTFCPDLEGDKVTHQTMKLLKPLYVLAFLNNCIYIRSSKKETLMGINLTKDRDVKHRSIYNASAIHYFSYIMDRKLVEWRKINEKRTLQPQNS